MSPGPLHGVFRALGSKVAIGWSEGMAGIGAHPAAVVPTPSPTPARGQLALDIFETAGYVVIKAPIAGVKLESLDIEVCDNVVTICGERRNSDDVAADRTYLQECYWGPFRRSVTLPFSVDAAKVKASFSRDGILKILIPRETRVRIVKISEAT